MNYLLDTCAVLWLATEPQRLSMEVLKGLEDSLATVGVSAITAGELACLVAKKRIQLPCHWRSWFRHAIKINGWKVFPVDLDVIEEAYSLPETFQSDPADRLLVATARLNRLTLVTGDQHILNYPHVRSAN